MTPQREQKMEAVIAELLCALRHNIANAYVTDLDREYMWRRYRELLWQAVEATSS